MYDLDVDFRFIAPRRDVATAALREDSLLAWRDTLLSDRRSWAVLIIGAALTVLAVRAAGFAAAVPALIAVVLTWTGTGALLSKPRLRRRLHARAERSRVLRELRMR